jgi:hypothetical protein
VNAFTCSLKTLARDKSTTAWAFLFPLVLCSLFYIAFTGLDDAMGQPVDVVVVDDAAYRAAPGLSETVDAVSSGDDQWLVVKYAPNAKEADHLVAHGDGKYYGYLAVSPSGEVEYHRDWRERPGLDAGNEVVAAVVDSYLQTAAFIAAHPGATVAQAPEFTKAVQLTANPPSDEVRYFYSALGFATMMVSIFATTGVARLRSGRSHVGARIAVGGLPRYRVLAPTVGAAYVLAFGTLVIGLVYVRYVLGVEFGGRETGILAILAVGAAATTAFGAAVAVLPLASGALMGLSAGISCLLSLFAGLYGPGSQELADSTAEAAPWFTWLNPAREMYDAFFSVYCYDSFDQAALILVRLALLALVLFGLAAFGMRRLRHEHI